MIALFVNYKSLSDGQLMERVRRKDDEKAFAELYRRYARLLQGFFFRRLLPESVVLTVELFRRSVLPHMDFHNRLQPLQEHLSAK